MSLPELDPCTFLDYRDFLAEFYRVRKESQAWYSYKALGDRVGMDASLVAKVLLKSRHIAEDSIARFAETCGLTDRLAEYFDAMVRFTKAKEDVEAKEWFEKMLSLRLPEARRLEGDSYLFYQRWYHTAIRAALDYFPYDGSDSAALAKHLMPAISEESVRESVALLESLQLISRDAQGFFRPTERGVTTGAGWKSVAVHTFQSETLRLALEALDRIPKNQRNYSTLTMSLTEADFAEVKERVRDFRQQLIKFIHSKSQGERVYQMNIQLLPLTECRRLE
jgi:uncharacterized protein (TIGR02147 family)